MTDPTETSLDPSFKLLTDLLSLTANPAASKARLAELAEAERRAAAATAQLARDRARHDQAIAADCAKLEEEREELRRRQVALAAEEGKLRATQEMLAESQAELDRKTNRFETFGDTGLVREYVPGQPRDMVLQREPVFQGDAA